MQLELRHLQAIRRIAEAGSLGTAARRLGVSQPALSAQLRRIERAVGGELFVRGPRGVEPTRLGEFVLARARRVLGEMDALGAEARGFAPGGPLRLGCILLVLVGALLDRTDAVMAGQELTVDVGVSVTALVRALAAGQYDAILYGEVNDHRVSLPDNAETRTVVPREPFCVRLSAAHPLAAREAVGLADLAGEQWLGLVEDDDGGPEALTEACARAGFTPQLRYRITDRTLGHELVAAGRAVALTQPTASAAPGTVLRPLTGDPLTGRVRLAWNRTAVSARQAGLLHRAAALAYLDRADTNPFLRRWWDAHPGLRPVVD
ncbi:LysR family transcriptional regulator [Streptomyces sp. LP05-1]|uniref:LysR family transcriptional regulator n=1 Tax=Streptomyces pyxinae TaxID=2970734 RepID=A0ABT2CPX6_9ACTN|nr:LysR family transcriptional regulator [Streptomyces sp. LP05-1]MCS0639492.1 LysR family transcriptional regulator [Streptomyces sp. LP05-1]